MSLPERINVIKVISYNTQQILDYFREEDSDYNPSIEEVLGYIEEWVVEDFGSLSGLIYQDENGNEL